MTTESALATTPKERVPVAMSDRGVNFESFDELARFCDAVHKSCLAPKGFDNPQAIMVAVQFGLEIGLGPMQALQSIAVINGRPSLWGDAALALATSRPDFEDIREWTEGDVAHCEIKRKGRTPVVRTFSDADAKAAGLLGKSGPWTQYKARMRQMRARSWALSDAFPDALRGVAVREEQEDVPVKEAKARVIEPEKVKFADEPDAESPRETLALA
jgi:hypothetical protein